MVSREDTDIEGFLKYSRFRPFEPVRMEIVQLARCRGPVGKVW